MHTPGNNRRRRAPWRAALLATALGAAAVVPSAAPAAAAADITFDGEAGDLTGITQTTSASVAPAAARNGTGGLLIAASAASGHARWTSAVVPQNLTHASVRLWVRVLSRGAGESVDVVTVGNALGSAHFDLFMSGIDGRLRWDLFRDDWDETSWSVTLGRWYLVEAQVEFEGTTHTAAVRIDGVHQGTISSAGTATTVRQLTVGTTVAKTHTQHYDDIAMEVANGPSGWLANTPPSVTVTSPTDGAVLESGSMVTADYACSSPDFPVTACAGAVADGGALPTNGVGPRQFSVTATDQAGQTTTVTRSYTLVDRTDPLVALRAPADGAIVAQDAALTADFGCSDPGGSGIAPTGGCVGDVADGAALATTELGPHTVTVTATDDAGNTATRTHTYTVVPNRPDGLIRPRSAIRMAGEDLYSASGSGQTWLSRVGLAGEVYLVRVENDGDADDTFRIRGSRSDPRWEVRYFAGAREISTAVKAGRYRVRGLAPDRGVVIRMVVTPTRAAVSGDQRRVTVTALAVRRPAKDTVGAVVRRA